jgi:hypothetical protein
MAAVRRAGYHKGRADVNESARPCVVRALPHATVAAIAIRPRSLAKGWLRAGYSAAPGKMPPRMSSALMMLSEMSRA